MRFLNVYEKVCVSVEVQNVNPGISSGANFIKFHQKNAPKSMKNVRFGSGFLHVILKLMHQQDYNKKITLTTFVREKNLQITLQSCVLSWPG